MTAEQERPERIDLSRCDDPRDAVHRAVAILARGGLVRLPTDGAPATIATALDADAVRRLLDGMSGRDPAEDRLTLLVRRDAELDDWAGPRPPALDRFARRCWPGPVVFSLACSAGSGLLGRLPGTAREALLSVDGRVRFGCPGHATMLEILDLAAGPLVLSDSVGEDHADLVLEQPVRAPRAGPSVVRFDAGGWELEFEGQLSRDELARRAATTVLFVCTGNTCRSPMAEVLLRALLADRLRCQADALLDAGFHIGSAGLAPQEGLPASPHAVSVMRERGLSLEDHASRGIDDGLIDGADLILAMTPGHLDALAEGFPDAIDRMRLVSANGQGIVDPYGGGLDLYRRTADMLARCVERIVDVIAPPDEET